jgi:hypothetical protein
MDRTAQIGGLLAAMSAAGIGVFCTSARSADPAPLVTGVGGQPASSISTTMVELPAREPAREIADAPRVTAGLGTDVVQSLGVPVAAKAAWLRVVAASEAERHALNAPDRITGYPVAGALRPVAPPDTTRLLGILFRDDSYDFDIRLRCANKRFLGVRFLAMAPVEFALGTPCNQAIWAFRRTGKVERWGAILSDRAAASFRSLLATDPSFR